MVSMENRSRQLLWYVSCLVPRKKKYVQIEYGAIYTAMRTFGGIGNAFANLPLPASLTKPPPDPTRAALMDQLMRQKLERDALIIEIQALHKIVNARYNNFSTR